MHTRILCIYENTISLLKPRKLLSENLNKFAVLSIHPKQKNISTTKHHFYLLSNEGSTMAVSFFSWPAYMSTNRMNP